MSDDQKGAIGVQCGPGQILMLPPINKGWKRWCIIALSQGDEVQAIAAATGRRKWRVWLRIPGALAVVGEQKCAAVAVPGAAGGWPQKRGQVLLRSRRLRQRCGPFQQRLVLVRGDIDQSGLLRLQGEQPAAIW